MVRLLSRTPCAKKFYVGNQDEQHAKGKVNQLDPSLLIDGMVDKTVDGVDVQDRVCLSGADYSNFWGCKDAVESEVDEAAGDRKDNVESGKDVKGAVHEDIDDDVIHG